MDLYVIKSHKTICITFFKSEDVIKMGAPAKIKLSAVFMQTVYFSVYFLCLLLVILKIDSASFFMYSVDQP